MTLGAGPGPVVGAVRGNDIFCDEAGAHLAGHVDGEGRVYDSEHEIVGRVDSSQLVADKFEARAGRVLEPVDAGVLLLLVAEQDREVQRDAAPGEDGGPTVMDEMFAAESEAKRPRHRGRRDPF